MHHTGRNLYLLSLARRKNEDLSPDLFRLAAFPLQQRPASIPRIAKLALRRRRRLELHVSYRSVLDRRIDQECAACKQPEARLPLFGPGRENVKDGVAAELRCETLQQGQVERLRRSAESLRIERLQTFTQRRARKRGSRIAFGGLVNS